MKEAFDTENRKNLKRNDKGPPVSVFSEGAQNLCYAPEPSHLSTIIQDIALRGYARMVTVEWMRNHHHHLITPTKTVHSTQLMQTQQICIDCALKMYNIQKSMLSGGIKSQSLLRQVGDRFISCLKDSRC